MKVLIAASNTSNAINGIRKVAQINADEKIGVSDNGDVLDIFSKAGIRCKNIIDMLPTEYDLTFYKEAAYMLRRAGRIRISGKTVNELMNYSNIPFWGVIEGNISDILSERTHAMEYAYAIDKISRSEKPDVIVSNRSSNLGRVCYSAAIRSGITFKPIGKTRAGIKSVGESASGYMYKAMMGLKSMQRGRKKINGITELTGKKVMLIPSIETMVPIIQPVIEELERRGNAVKIIKYDLLRDRMKRELERHNIDHSVLEGYLTKDTRRNAKKASILLKNRWNGISKNDDFISAFNFRGISLWDFANEGIRQFFRGRSRISEVTSYIEAMRCAMRAEHPDIVITLEGSSCFGMPTMLIAKELGIPSLVVQHGSPIFTVGPIVMDKIALWGNYTKRKLLERGFKRSQVEVAGCPKYDNVYKIMHNSSNIRSELGINKSIDIILFAGQPSSSNEKYLTALFSAAKNMSGKILVIKPHPRVADQTIYQNVAKNVGIKIIVSKADLFSLLAVSELMITMTSTAALDAIVMEKPVIMFHPSGKKDMTMYEKRGVAIGVNDDKKLDSTIEMLLKDNCAANTLRSNASDFISDYAFRMDGKASERIVDLAEDMMRKNQLRHINRNRKYYRWADRKNCS